MKTKNIFKGFGDKFSVKDVGKSLAFCVVVFGLLVSVNNVSASMVPINATELNDSATHVVIGDTTDIWYGALYSPDEYVNITVNKTIKGLIEPITIKQDIVLHGTPNFEIGEEAMLFLRKDGGYFYLVGLSQGKFSPAIDPKTGKKYYVNALGMKLNESGGFIGYVENNIPKWEYSPMFRNGFWRWTKWANPLVLCEYNPTGGPAANPPAGRSPLGAINAAANTWTNIPNSNFKLQILNLTSDCNCRNHFDGKNCIGWAPLGINTNAAAWTRGGAGLANCPLVEADICFNTNRVWFTGPGINPAGAHDLETIALHEFGHWLSLDDLNALAFQKVVLHGIHPAGHPNKRSPFCDDRSGAAYLYTPMPAAQRCYDSPCQNKAEGGCDLGDAPDTPYPSLENSNGARHKYIPEVDGVGKRNCEWLGDNVSYEVESRQVNRDTFDDGVIIGGNLVPGGNLMLTIQVSTRPPGAGLGPRYIAGNANRVMYLNAWVDWNGNGIWAPGEKIINGFQVVAAGNYNFNIPIPPNAKVCKTTWLRVRLDYAENVGANRQLWTDASLNQPVGEAHFGEVEDYPIHFSKRRSTANKIGCGDTIYIGEEGLAFDVDGNGVFGEAGTPDVGDLEGVPGTITTGAPPLHLSATYTVPEVTEGK